MYISIDLGGTNTRVASSVDLRQIYKVEKFDTQPHLEAQKEIIKSAISKVTEKNEVKAIAIGVPGMLDRKNQRFHRLPNYPNLNNVSYNSLFDGDLARVPMYVENDSALAGLGEAVLGVGMDYNSIAYLTLGTGVGGVRIEKKSLHFGQRLFEPGHQIIARDGRYHSGCGQHGCLEGYVSGRAFVQIYGVKPENCNDIKVWSSYGSDLAVGLINVIAMWSPDVIILGGGLANKFYLFYKSLIKRLQEETVFDIPPIRRSENMDNAGLLGGFVLIGQSLKR